MTEIGYALSSEEHPPNDLVRFAARAEEAGFSFALISDHFHPWIGAQGQTQTKTFDSEERAQREAEKLTAEKLRKGYEVV